MAITKMDFKTGAFGYSVVVGACLLLLPIGVHVYWSNMSVYALSYINRDLDSKSDFHFSWIISLSLIFRSGVFFIIDFIAKIIGARNTVLCGIALFNAGMLTSYFSVQMSTTMLNVTVGGLCGFGGALLNGIVLKCVLPKCKTSLGLVTAVIQSSYSIGGMIIIQAVTLYINPYNLAPDRKLKHDFDFFTQTSILSKVPTIFVILGCVIVIIQSVGFILFKNILSEPAASEEHILSTNVPDKSPESDDGSSHSDSSLDKFSTNYTYQNMGYREMGIKEMLRSRPFYVLFVVKLTNQYAFLLVSYYYKIYGLKYVKDDHLMSNLGTAMAIASICMRLLNGTLVDKLGVKTDFVLVCAVYALSSQFFFTSIRIHKWLYFIVVVVVNGSSSAGLSVFTVATLKTFGKNYFMLKLALVSTASLLTTILATPIMEIIVFNWGWFVVSTLLGVTTVVNSAIITWCFPYIR